MAADIKLLEYKPSTIAAAALLYASHELFPQQYSILRTSITACEYIHEVNYCQLFYYYYYCCYCFCCWHEDIGGGGGGYIIGDIVQVLWFDARDGENGSKGVNDRYKQLKQ